MTLPARFRNVHYYRIAGRYTFTGDLFITSDAFYFFPEVDLEQQRHEISRGLPSNFAILAFAVMYVAQKTSGAYMSRFEFQDEALSQDEFHEQAMAYIDKLKSERAHAAFSETLPVPTRVVVSEISSMNLSWSGRLSFSAQSDRHDFNIGLLRKKSLQNALVEAGWFKSEKRITEGV